MEPDRNIELSTIELCRALDIPRERLREWQVRGYVVPTRMDAWGTREKAIFNRREIYLVEAFRRLLNLGLLREHAGAIIDGIRNDDKPITTTQARTGTCGVEALHIMVIYMDEKGRPVKVLETLGDCDMGLNLSTGRLLSNINGKPFPVDGFKDSDGKPVGSQTPSWDNILIIDFGKVRAHVDERLG